jgi:hypothetical protein
LGSIFIDHSNLTNTELKGKLRWFWSFLGMDGLSVGRAKGWAGKIFSKIFQGSGARDQYFGECERRRRTTKARRHQRERKVTG